MPKSKSLHFFLPNAVYLMLYFNRLEYLSAQVERIRDYLGVAGLRISNSLKKSIEDQVLGLKKLELCVDIFIQLGNVSDLHLVLADRYATAQHYGQPKLFIPFDFVASELVAYLERGAVPERYAKRDKQREAAEAAQAAMDESFFDEFSGDEFDEEDEEEYDDDGDLVV